MSHLRSIIFLAAIALAIVACQSVGDTDDRDRRLSDSTCWPDS